MVAFETAMLRSIDQIQAGEYGRVSTPAQIDARRKGGRPVKADAKQAVKLRLDPDLLDALRASGRGWQTRGNAMLRRDVLGV